VNADQLYMHGFLWGLGLGAALGALIMAIWHAGDVPAMGHGFKIDKKCDLYRRDFVRSLVNENDRLRKQKGWWTQWGS